jgi:phosphatidylserine decarboxylase
MSVVPPPKRGAVPHPSQTRRIGGWLPQDPDMIRRHVKEVLKQAKVANLPIVPPVAALQVLLDTNPAVYMLFTEMLTEVPTTPPYNKDPDGKWEITDVPDLVTAINYQIQNPIVYNDSLQIGTPLNAILDWPMATKAGFAAFIRNDVDQVFGKILRYWGSFLTTEDSALTVTTADGGWLSPVAQAEEAGLKNFLQTYVVPDPNDPIHYGFTSWDQFFTRKFVPGLRPVEAPSDDSVIVSAAESTPFYIQANVQLRDTFWVKNKDQRSNYSLVDMLGDESIAQNFVGGTVYQAFLSADSYHNWHAPVSGKYISAPNIIPGTYYSEPLMWGFDPDVDSSHPDPGADELSQGYISAVAKRGVVLIQANNPEIGLMAIVMIGMAEVSSIDFDSITSFNKGDMIGRFHFGGSTYCLIFGPNVDLTFSSNAVPSPDILVPGPPVPVRSAIATVI